MSVSTGQDSSGPTGPATLNDLARCMPHVRSSMISPAGELLLSRWCVFIFPAGLRQDRSTMAGSSWSLAVIFSSIVLRDITRRAPRTSALAMPTH